MSAITVKGLKVTACHGVLAEEKTNPQPFVFDIDIDCSTYAAAQSDDVNQTVNYAEVCSLVAAYCGGNCFNLIEKLAYGAAFMLAKTFPQINGVSVTVHKPQAPIGLPFGDVSVTARVGRNTVALALGSSVGDGKAILNGALEMLSKVDGVKLLKVSDFIFSEPYGGAAHNTFTNGAAIIECLLPPCALLDELHKIEAAFGRVRTVRWGDRTLDLDIIFFGNKIIAEEGLCVPHPDYLNRPFVLEPLKSIAPDFVCPKCLKRIADL